MEIKDDKNVKRLSAYKDNLAESTVDYTLPDYLGEVRKILYTECCCGPFGKYSSEGAQELSGSVSWNIMYLDSEGKPTGASFTSDYEMTVKGGENAKDVFASPAVSGYTLRLVGPRKLSGKAQINLSPKILFEDDKSPVGSAFEKGEEAETDTKILRVATKSQSELYESEYAEMLLKLDGAIADEVAVLCPDAVVRFSSVHYAEDHICLKGELVLRAVINEADLPMYCCEKSIPIEEHIGLGMVRDDMILTPHANICSLVTKINPGEDGTEIVMSVIVEYTVDGESNDCATVITDAYLKRFETENTYEDYRYTTLLDKLNVCETLSCKFPLNTVCQESVREIHALDATLKIEDTELSSDTLGLKGEIKLSGFTTVTDESGETGYAPLKLIAPFELKVKCPKGVTAESTVELSLNGSSPCAIIDNDEAEFNYKVLGNITFYGSDTVKLLKSSDVSESGEICRRKGRITVYYPDGSETLFSVAKKFHTSSLSVAVDNNLSVSVGQTGEESTLDGVKCIIIRDH